MGYSKKCESSLRVFSIGLLVMSVAVTAARADEVKPSLHKAVATQIAQNQLAQSDVTRRQVAQGMALINYVPPGNRGAPTTRIGGGTRSAATAVTVEVMAPEHTGHTGSASPVLHWRLDGGSAESAVVTIIGRDAIDPVLETEVQLDPARPVQTLDLAALGVTLAPNVDYEWSVSIVPDRTQRSLDAMAGGTIRYVPTSADGAGRIASAQGVDRAIMLAEAGYWYDAMAVAHEAYMAGSDGRAREAAVALLKQVGLDGPAKAY